MHRKALHSMMFAVVLVSVGSHKAVAQPTSAAPNTSVCHGCIRIRVGLPRVLRGPAPNIADNFFTEIQLSDGRFRGFTAAGPTYAIDAAAPWQMSGPLRMVLPRGAASSPGSCGQWLQHAELAGSVLFGFVHDEMDCHYQIGQTHKSMSLATSSDGGLTWKDQGQILTGIDRPVTGKNTGVGDCTVLNGQDGFYYAYCGRPGDGTVIVARAPVLNPWPGNWHNYFQGAWEQPGLGGNATSLGNTSMLTTSAARWKTTGETLLLGKQPGGLGLNFSQDRINFTHLRDPLLPLDHGIWKRPDPSEIVTYAAILDAGTGSNQLSNSWMMVYTYLQPNEGFDKRYLVFRNIDVTVTDHPVLAQTGVLLARWYNSVQHDRWPTTAAVPGNYSAYQLEAKSGYLMTAADPALPTVELEDCVSQNQRHTVHMLAEKGFCAAHEYQRLRTAGFVYSAPPDGTVPLYRCYNALDRSHFASNQPDCESLGTMENLLGYTLSK